MHSKIVHQVLICLLVGGGMSNALAGSVGLDALSYDGNNGQVSVTVIYDFTDENVFGGALNLIYDAGALVFVTYEAAPLQPDVWAPASPVGSLDSPGFYQDFGIAANKLQGVFGGITSAGEIGTFTFLVLDSTHPSATPCGMTLCLEESSINPWLNVSAEPIGDALLASGISGANVIVPVPVPSAYFLLLSSVAGLFGVRRFFKM
ncbi:MAG: hypothetical protein AAF465_14375 [Pseudomonadota bacterium]